MRLKFIACKYTVFIQDRKEQRMFFKVSGTFFLKQKQEINAYDHSQT